MGIRTRLFALTYDRQMGRAERAGLAAHRERLLAGAAGRVLEIGAGTGINLQYYGPAVESLTLTEPEPPMLRRLDRRVREHGPLARALRAPAEDLPFADDAFDVAVSTLVLCGVEDQRRALRELQRVLRPGGRLLFMEHVRSGEERLARMQDRMNPVNRFLVGCECNRPTVDAVRAAGFTVDELVETSFPKAPAFTRPLVIGRATAPARVPDGAAALPA